MSLAVVLWLCCQPAQVPPPEQPRVTFTRLLHELADLDGLTHWPDPPFVMRQFSSRDRRSVDPRETENWFADQDRGNSLYDGVVTHDTPYHKDHPDNGRRAEGVFPKGTRVGLVRQRAANDHVWAYATAPDGGLFKGRIPQGYIPRRNFQPDPEGHVLAEMDGPGCLVRLWSANPSEGGMVRIYLDHAPEPIIAARLQDLLGGSWAKDIQGKKVIPFPKPLVGERGKGWTLLFPIPYQKHCKVVVEKPELAYHIGYRTYDSRTMVQSFSWEVWAKHQAEVETVAHRFETRNVATKTTTPVDAPRLPQPNIMKSVDETELEPGQSIVFRAWEGSGCVQRLELRLVATRPVEALRGLLLSATFDDGKAPQVCCPLGDFFATSPGANAHHSLPLSVSADLVLASSWRMPFSHKAVFALTNHGRHRVQLKINAMATGHVWSAHSLHFHAKWCQQFPLSTRPYRDWSACHLRGQGMYVGTMLSVMNPVSGWWGEGDDKTYVDGEAFPSLFGTATDEYFGYASGHRQPFHHWLYNLTRCDGPGHHGHASMNRFLLLDRIPFTKEFRFDLELRHWTPGVNMAYAVTCYWYAKPGLADDFTPPSSEQLWMIHSPPALHRLAGAWEGEQLQILRQSSKFPIGPQDVISAEGAWSNGAQLYAQAAKKDEWVELAVPVTRRGPQRLLLYLTQGPQYGTLRFHVDGKTVNSVYHGYRTGNPKLAPPLDLGTFNLEPGTLTLRIETAGADRASVFPRFAWGLDAVVLEPVK
jgi:hypothetical protein